MGVTASVVGIAGGINSLTGGSITKGLGLGGGSTSASGGSTSTASGAQTAVDPFASYRPGVASLYANYLGQGDTPDPTKMPGYSQFQTGVMDPALEASKRSSAASGMMRSGNEQIALQNIGQQGYSSFMTNYMNQLATGSGAGYAPAAGGQAAISQGNLNQQSQMQGLGAIIQGAGSFGSSGFGSSTASSTGGAAGYGITADQYAGYYSNSGG